MRVTLSDLGPNEQMGLVFSVVFVFLLSLVAFNASDIQQMLEDMGKIQSDSPAEVLLWFLARLTWLSCLAGPVAVALACLRRKRLATTGFCVAGCCGILLVIWGVFLALHLVSVVQ